MSKSPSPYQLAAEAQLARIQEVAPELFAAAVSQGMNAPFALDCDYWGREYTEKLLTALGNPDRT